MNASCTASSAALRSCRTKSAKRSIECVLARSKRSKSAGLLARTPSSPSMPATVIETPPSGKVWWSLDAGRNGVRHNDGATSDLRTNLEHLIDDILGDDTTGAAEAGGVVRRGEDLLAGLELAG